MPFWSSSSSSNSSSPSPSQSARDEAADAELRELLAAIDAEHKAATEAREQRDAADAELRDERFRSGFEDRMNCLTAFDEMYYCFSLGGQFLNVYRHGEWRDCSEKSADWRFCMRTKAVGPITRKAMIQARNKEKAARFKTGPNSEDIWKLRKEPLRNPFSGNLGDLEQDALS